MRNYTRPEMQLRLASIIESGPYESTGNKLACIDITHPFLCTCSPSRNITIVSLMETLLRISLINTTRHHRTCLFGEDTRQIRELFMNCVDIAYFIIIRTLYIYGIGKTFPPTTVHGSRARTSRIQFALNGFHALNNHTPLLCSLYGRFFVSQTPNDNRRMIPVAANDCLQLAQTFITGAQYTQFIHDQHTQRVASIQDRFRRRIMGGAVCIYSILFQTGDSPRIQLVRNSNPHTGMVLVAAYPLNLYSFAIEEETFVGIETDVTDTERGIVAIDNCPIQQNISMQRIKRRSLQRP